MSKPPTGVTVIVPAYGGIPDLVQCLDSIIRHGAETVDLEVLVIDDASPEAQLAEVVESIGDDTNAPRIRLIRNQRNLGFVATVNRGLRATSGDVVVLNSDTVVTARWVDRLAQAGRAPDVASVTPLSNFGSICTLPDAVVEQFDLSGDAPSIDDCADFIERTSLGLRPEIISGVGFCMYMTREAIDEVGLFDERTFGAGYGEEVDWCIRATRLGFRHVAEDSTFVLHRGAGSFGASRTERMAAASDALHSRYHFFRPQNATERSRDPLAVAFAAMELELGRRDPQRPHVLHLLHSPPGEVGGTEKHLRVLMSSLADRFDSSILYPVHSGFALRALWRTPHGESIGHDFLLPGGPHRVTATRDEIAARALETAIELFDIDAVHIHNMIGHSLAAFDVLRDFDGPVVCSVRDLFLACPHHWLLYRNKVACGLPSDLSVCARCLPETRELSVDDLVEHRQVVAAGLDAVDHWVFASHSALDFFRRVYELPGTRVDVIEHGSVVGTRRRPDLDQDLILDEPLRLAFVGMGWAKKGLDVVNALADRLAESSIEVHHFGRVVEPVSANVLAHGEYDNEQLSNLLRASGIHVVLLPGPYAETFGHVMTESLVAGLPVVGASYGSLGARIRSHRCGWTIDPTDVDSITDLVVCLDRTRDEVLRATRAATEVTVRPVKATADRYASLYLS